MKYPGAVFFALAVAVVLPIPSMVAEAYRFALKAEEDKRICRYCRFWKLKVFADHPLDDDGVCWGKLPGGKHTHTRADETCENWRLYESG